ncbi:prepilin peptidase [Salinicoccus sesuvii]|uniref:Prepilin peptidase n=1 Tax=Salinicoccus sesuvii TaxID=868281 RepID=A0ABV7N210_9STAP
MLTNVILLIILLVCTITDIRKRKIYNKVVFPSLAVAFAVGIISDGLSGFGASTVGFLVGFLLLLIPYIFGGMGAGDVKLMALIGALKGYEFVIESFIYTALIGGLLAVGVIIVRGGFKRSLGVGMPYGVAIAGGAVMALVMDVTFL